MSVVVSTRAAVVGPYDFLAILTGPDARSPYHRSNKLSYQLSTSVMTRPFLVSGRPCAQHNYVDLSCSYTYWRLSIATGNPTGNGATVAVASEHKQNAEKVQKTIEVTQRDSKETQCLVRMV